MAIDPQLLTKNHNGIPVRQDAMLYRIDQATGVVLDFIGTVAGLPR